MSSMRSIRNRRRRGFTLVELMVSLVMGLIVALAAVALARTATTTFHEQARSSLTEMGVRTAAERLRQDLMRVSYMTTGNIKLDPKVARRADWTTAAQIARYSQFVNLQGIRIRVGGSKAATQGTLNLATNNLLAPDTIEITGNTTTDDSYNGQITMGGCSGGGQTVRLDPQADAAVWSLAGGDAGASTLAKAQAAFQPIAGKMFIAQVTDALGCVHFAPVCNVTVSGDVINVQLQGDGQRAVLYSHSEAGQYENPPGLANNCGSSEGGKVTIAPVQIVRWELRPSPTALQADPALEPVGNKFDVTRTLLDFASTPATTPEIVAEYAVDLKFGVTVYNPVAAAAGTDPLLVHEMDTDPGGGSIDQATQTASTTLAGQVGPQHVRSVRFRVATRTSMADRQSDIVIGPPRSLSQPYMSRYCMEDQPLASCKKFARVRTIVSEVALHNQARMFY